MKSTLDDLYAELKANSNANEAVFMAKYMKDRFQFFGIKKPRREEIEKKYYSKLTKLSLEDLKFAIKYFWEKPERECQYIAMVIIDKNTKILDKEMLYFLEELILAKSWWDTVDYLAAKPVGIVLQRHPELIKPTIQKWIESGNIWLQRTSLLFQLKYKNNTDYNLLFDLSRQLSDSKEFFIQKAIGWALREYSKTNPGLIKQFIKHNKLAPLSVREGLKVINRSYIL